MKVPPSLTGEFDCFSGGGICDIDRSAHSLALGFRVWGFGFRDPEPETAAVISSKSRIMLS